MRKELRQLGLSNKEVEIYIAGLKLGQATIQRLLETTTIKRSTIYIVLERLKQKGLVTQGFKNCKKVFEMAAPEKILKIAKEEKEKATQRENNIKNIFSALENLAKNPKFITDVKMCEGFGEIEEILLEFAKTKDLTFTIYSSHYLDKLGQELIIKTISKINRVRARTKNKIHIITDANLLSARLYRLEETDIREFRFLPENVKLPAMLDICGDKIALSYLSEPYGAIVVQNKMIAEMMKMMFDLIWQSLEEKNLPSKEQQQNSLKYIQNTHDLP